MLPLFSVLFPDERLQFSEMGELAPNDCDTPGIQTCCKHQVVSQCAAACMRVHCSVYESVLLHESSAGKHKLVCTEPPNSIGSLVVVMRMRCCICQ